MIKFKSPLQLVKVGAVLSALEYDANTRTSQAANGTIIISNRTRTIEIYTNGEDKYR